MSARTRRPRLSTALLMLLLCGMYFGGCESQEAPTQQWQDDVVIVQPNTGSTDLGDGLSISVESASYVGPTVTILWRNRSDNPAFVRLEAPLGVSEADKLLLKRGEGTKCMGADGPKLEGAYEAGWNLASFTIPPHAWDFSYLAGFVAEERNCIVALRILRPRDGSENIKKILIDAALRKDRALTGTVSTGDKSSLIVSAKTAAITRVSDLHVSARLDLLVENIGSQLVQTSTELLDVKCHGDWQPKLDATRDWIAAITEQQERRPVEPGSWIIFSLILTSEGDWPRAGACTSRLVVSEYGRDNRLIKTIPVDVEF